MLKRAMTVLVLTISSMPAFGQWVEQEVYLQPGWNSVYLTVQPVPSACSELFDGLPIVSVSWWSREPGQADFDSDPNQTFPRSPNWLNWYANDAKANTFGSLIAGESYIIVVDENAAPFTLSIKGVPRLGTGNWLAGSPGGFSGLPVPDGNTLPFAHFFSFTDEINPIDNQSVSKVNANGTYSPVFRLALEPIQAGAAYWVGAAEYNSDFYGPLNVRLLSPANTMDYSKSFTSRQLEIENVSGADRVVTIRHLTSEEPPFGGGLPSVADRVPLLQAHFNPTSRFSTEEYLPLPDTVVTNIPAGERIVLKLLPDRAQGGGLSANETFQSILQVTDENNDGETQATVQHRVGVSWNGEVIDHTGLWVGSVSVTHVSRAQTQEGVLNTWDHTEPTSVVRPYVFRAIFHLGSDGQTHLLQRVLPAWIPDGETVNTSEGIQTNGTYELLTDEHYAELVLQEHPAATITRISSVNFPKMKPLPMVGSLGLNGVLDGTIELPFDDPVNPFVHRFHPMHDNKEYRNGTASPLGEGKESPTVTRGLKFEFSETDPERGSGNPLWGVSELGGTFTETVQGLNKSIYVRGQFRIQKINETPVLNYLDQF